MATVTITPTNAKAQDPKCGIYTIADMPNGNGNLTPKSATMTTNQDGSITFTVPYNNTVSSGNGNNGNGNSGKGNNTGNSQLYVFVQCEAAVKIL
ncbi:MAG: hypothetical protein FWG55_07845 [Candidatus Bathyarchaeota archaeon]|nr:hypothetical protein [Candidatus Termiticorpusculum sp.]